MATERQVRYALYLMERAGYGTRYMRSEHSRLGARCRERRGTVEGWLYSLSTHRCSEVIEQLLAELAAQRD